MITSIHILSHYHRKQFSTLLVTIAVLLVTSACSRLDEIESRLETLESKVETLEDATEVLHTFYVEGKVINNITSVEGGYQITFSDEHQLNIYDGITPLLLIDQDDFWNISYDGGETYSRMKDCNGDNISASGASIKATTDEKGNYVLVQYMSGEPDSIVSTITTPLSSDSAKILYSIIEDSKSHLITVTMANGEEFTFTKAHSIPTSIVLLNTQTLLLGKKDTISIEFRVNPSIATFNYDIKSLDCQLFLDKVSETRSYITTPTAYAMIGVEQVYDDMGIMKTGQYRAYITDLNMNAPYSDNIALVLRVPYRDDEYLEVSSSAITIKYTDNTLRDFSFLKQHNPTSVISDVRGIIDGNRIKVMSPYITDPTHLIPTFHSSGYKVLVDGIRQESSVTPNDYSQPVTYRVENHFGEYTEYTVEVIHSGLPIVFVDTPDKVAINSKEEWLESASIRIVDTDGALMHEGSTAIKGRGNTSWGFPKKSYNLKLADKATILGMPEHKRWVLLANWMDRTLLRNRIAFKLGECTLPYSPRSEYVELILNGKHMGNYLLCEQIRIDENRVNIHPLTTTDEDITGGYLMEIDKNYDEVHKFRSEIKDFPYMFKKPDEEVLTDTMFNYMQNFINEMEHYLYNDFKSRKWAEYINLESFIDFWFAAELTSNDEYGWPKSTYMYKDQGGNLCAGPLWDNDWYTFIPANSQRYILKKHLYYPVLFKDREFISIVKERWSAAKGRLEAVPNFIDAEAQRIKSSDRINISMWPISLRVNEDETLSFNDAVHNLKSAYSTKLNWLDRKISAM